MHHLKKTLKVIIPLFLTVLLLAAFSACEQEEISAESSSFSEAVSSVTPSESSVEESAESSVEDSFEESAETPSEETSSEEEPEPPAPPTYELLNLSVEAIPPAENLSFVMVNKNIDTALDAFLKTYEGSYPAVSDVVYTEDSLQVCVVYDVLALYGAFQAKYLWYTFDCTNGTLTSPTKERPTAYEYDKNTHNQKGYFWVDYEEAASGEPCPYVVLYHENGVNTTLCFEETALEYVRVIRQTDTHVVLSVSRRGERYYRVLNREGKVIAQLEWISDVSSITPLMFDEKYLYCKKDSDEDFVYDTIGAIDLSTGKYQDILVVGNSDYWTYFADGSGIAIYDNEFQPDTILYYATATHKLLTYPAKRRVESLDTFYGTLYGTIHGDDVYVFLWDAESKTLFQSQEGYPDGCRLAVGKGSVAVMHDGVLSVYVEK